MKRFYWLFSRVGGDIYFKEVVIKFIRVYRLIIMSWVERGDVRLYWLRRGDVNGLDLDF